MAKTQGPLDTALPLWYQPIAVAQASVGKARFHCYVFGRAFRFPLGPVEANSLTHLPMSRCSWSALNHRIHMTKAPSGSS